MTIAKTSRMRNETKQKKHMIEFTINQETAGGIEELAGNVTLIEAVQIQALLTPHQKVVTQDDSNFFISRGAKSWMNLNRSQNDSSLNSLSTTLKKPKNTKCNNDKQILVVNEKKALSSQPHLSEGRCTTKKEVKNQNVLKRRKNKIEIVDKNLDLKEAVENLVQSKRAEELIEHRNLSDEKKMKESVGKLKKDTALTELIVTSDSSHLLLKAKQMKSVEENKSKVQDRALQSIQDTVSSIGKSVRAFPSSRTRTHDAAKRKVPQKNSCSENLLIRIKSEINLAEDKEKMRSICTCRKAVDDQAITDLKNQENFSFGWLKLQLETRVNKEKKVQMGWRYRRDLEISPIQSGNAKKALNIWKTMEQSNTAKI
ncbi:unnamed protein product [Brugia timori]|uniref:Myb_DNA-bind_5 domain-containing protein n=1 Tax=Brugia timori TaxID=42155 RepID=A0A0R3QR53_9BILA|nr:unnamed protein product [Brugia timori]